jgi:hypothetical protein
MGKGSGTGDGSGEQIAIECARTTTTTRRHILFMLRLKSQVESWIVADVNMDTKRRSWDKASTTKCCFYLKKIKGGHIVQLFLATPQAE